jgi:hypothetical protein
VAEYDAFGRRVGEDPLAELGWRIADAPAEPARPAPVAAPVFVRRRPRRRRRRHVLVYVLPLAAAGALLVYGAGGAVEEITGSLPAAPQPERVPAGLEEGSLIGVAGFDDALRRLRTARLGRLTLLRVAPDRIDARLLTRRGRLRNVQIRHDGALRDFGASAGGFGFVDTIPFARVHVAAPERLTRAAARRLGVRLDRVDFLVLTTAGWSVVFEGGRQFQGDRQGQIVRRIS